jgi:hypothetical protein
MKKLLLVLFLLPTIVFGRKFYVSDLGSDAHSNTQAQSITTPWKTLSKVQSSLGTFQSGDSILFAKGSKFSGTLTLQSKTGLYFGVYGTGAAPLFWGTGVQIGSLVTTRNCTNVTFYGWNISDTTISFSNRFTQAKIQIVFTFESSSTGIVIRKCTMDRIGYGLYITETSPGNTMDSSDIGNLRMIRNTQGGNDDYGGVPVQISSSNNTITSNYFHDCYAESYDYNLDGGGVEFFEEGVVIENNVIAYNTFINGNGVFEFGSNADGVANNLIRNNKIYYNKFINNNTIVYINNNSEYTTKVINLQFYNNVIVQTADNSNPEGSSGIQFSMMTGDATAGIIVLKNNIIQVSNGIALTRSGQLTNGQLVHTNNIYRLSNNTVTNFTLDATETGTGGKLWIDTTSNNPLNWNYGLLSTASARNSGVYIGITRDLNNQVVNNPPDIGPLQYISSVPPTPCTFTYGAWSSCAFNSQTRSYTATPSGCSGTPSPDSLQRSCVSPSCTFIYGEWGPCIGGKQTRSYLSFPTGCSGVPPTDSVNRGCSNPISRRTFYVSESGSDAYSKKQAQNPATPWKTLAKVSNSISNNDSVLFAKGSKFSGTITIQSKSNVYFGVYGSGADPLFWGTGSTIGVLVTLRASSNITFYGWNISDTTISFTDRTVQAKIQTVFQLENSSSNNVFRKCTMDRIGYGAYFNVGSNANTMDSCNIGNLRMIRNTPQSQNPDDDYGGVPIQISSRNNIFTNNYLHDCYSVSYDYGYDGGGVEFFEEGDTIKGNRIMYNTFYDCNGAFEFGSSNNSVADNPQVDNVIAYNKIINSSSLIYINNNGQYRTKVTNLQLYNNIFVQTVPSRTGDMNSIAMATSDATAGIVVLKNNIFQISNGAAVARGNSQWTAGQLTHTNNIYKLSNGSVTNFTLESTERGSSGNTWIDTTDQNPLNWNYGLLSSSYAVSNGVNVGLTRDFGNNVVGIPPSIGIYQYGSTKACTSYIYGEWSSCVNGVQTRTYTGIPADCIGTPPTDAIQRNCNVPIIIIKSRLKLKN